VSLSQKPPIVSSNFDTVGDSTAGYHANGFEPLVLLWDCNLSRRQTIEQLIRSTGAQSLSVEGSSQPRNRELSFQPSLALVALDRPSSLEVIRDLHSYGIKVIAYENNVLTWPIAVRCRALLSGAAMLLDSAAETSLQELQEILITTFAKEREQKCEEQELKTRMKELGIIGVSSQMLSIFRWVMRVSSLSDFPVLINGETGTGKELIANALHRLDGKRKQGPFIAANCGAISSGLAESELFGHRRGAFTGADTERKGLFRSAEGGVLFLDEIGELSPSLQAKLLRVLQEDRVLGVGCDKEVSVDVRVVAATNQNLESMIAAGTFREDLYHRLNVLSVTVPPLRERREDLRPLVEHFLEKYAHLNDGTQRRVSADFLEALQQVNLTGNARQLENIVRRALVTGSSNEILSLSDLTPAEWGQLSREVDRPGSQSGAVQKEGEKQFAGAGPTELQPDFLSILDQHDWNLSRSLEFCERALLECALKYTRGNQSHTARLIGITPRSVYNKLQKHKLNH
jgi:Nif-specific regulatory protein